MMVPAGSAIIPASFRRMARQVWGRHGARIPPPPIPRRLPFIKASRTPQWPHVAILTLALAACATIEPPRPPAEPRIEYRSYPVEKPVPCFTEAERPVLAPYTPINLDTATVDQMAAAMAADDLADQLFASPLTFDGRTFTSEADLAEYKAAQAVLAKFPTGGTP